MDDVWTPNLEHFDLDINYKRLERCADMCAYSDMVQAALGTEWAIKLGGVGAERARRLCCGYVAYHVTRTQFRPS